MALDSLTACIEQLDEEEGTPQPNWMLNQTEARTPSPLAILPKMHESAEDPNEPNGTRSGGESPDPPDIVSSLCAGDCGAAATTVSPHLGKGGGAELSPQGASGELSKDEAHWKAKYEALQKQYSKLKRNRDHLLWYHLRRVNFLAIPTIDPMVARTETLEQVGPYRIGQLLGDGGFARVKACTHFKSRESFAVKIISKEFADYTQAKMINTEIATMRAMNHRNIVRFQDVLHTESNIYIVMEYAPGGNLKDEIKRNTPREHRDEETVSVRSSLSVEKMRKIATQLLGAVGHLHARRLAHCDLKPENVLFSRSGDVKLADFGLSRKCVNPLTQGAGSPGFAAPEIVMGHSYDGLVADAFALGVILLEMLCGQPQFNPYAKISYSRKGGRPDAQRCEEALEKLRQSPLRCLAIGCL